MAEKPVRARWFVWAKWFAIAIIFGLMARVLFANFGQLRDAHLEVRWWLVAVSFPFAVGYLLVRAFLWHLMSRRMIGRFPLAHDATAWMVSLAGKYLPGKVFLYVGRVQFYRGAVEDAVTRATAAFLVETATSFLATCTLLGVAALVSPDAFAAWLRPVSLGALAMLALAHPSVLGRAINAVRRAMKQPPIVLGLRARELLGFVALMVGNWLLLGTGFWLLLKATMTVPDGSLAYVTASFATAGIIGVMAVFAPSGIGVREGVLAGLLSAIMSPGQAVLAAIAARLWLTVAEVLCAGAAFAVRKRPSPVTSPPSP